MDPSESFGEMLPWLKKYRDAVIVIKVGGHAMVDPAARSSMIKDIVTLKYLGARPIIVHGGGPEIDAMMKRMGKTPKFVSGLRVTDEETLEIVRMVLVGNVSSDIVSLISKYGGNGVGIIGSDGDLIVARRKAPEKAVVDGKETEVDYGWVGETVRINPQILSILLDNEYIPVISPIGYDEDGNCLNLNADTAAGDIAAAIKARSLVSLTDVDGVLMDPANKDTLISQLNIAQCYDLIEKGVISKGMIPKVLSTISVVKSGIQSVHIINGNIPHALLQELLTDKGIGTCITKE
ncbi:MAG TPA: acetylglutamate kinase [Methanocella sp.]|uniref:acetylglutamate kinase n=1 Tax=Methanocella sp. TaxID=2052833 RepID=UPI002C851CDA|nr:acetylglutamate kinase [Methanocella sp.]HTY92164.1 acetylglutamate kinase [Methanocella sp.]